MFRWPFTRLCFHCRFFHCECLWSAIEFSPIWTQVPPSPFFCSRLMKICFLRSPLFLQPDQPGAVPKNHFPTLTSPPATKKTVTPLAPSAASAPGPSWTTQQTRAGHWSPLTLLFLQDILGCSPLCHSLLQINSPWWWRERLSPNGMSQNEIRNVQTQNKKYRFTEKVIRRKKARELTGLEFPSNPHPLDPHSPGHAEPTDSKITFPQEIWLSTKVPKQVSPLGEWMTSLGNQKETPPPNCCVNWNSPCRSSEP